MLNGGVNMGYLEDLIKSKQVQQGDTTQKTVAPIVRHARTRAKVTREAEEGTNRLWQLRTQPKVIQQDNRTTTQKIKDRKEADEKHQQYQQQLNEQKATEGFNNLLKLTSPSTYVEAATGQQLTPAGKFATDILAFGIAGGAKSLLTRGGSKAISSPRTLFPQRTLGQVKGISGEIPTTTEQWNAAYRAAYNRGDRAEGQRLWDLWFRHQAKNNKLVGENNFPIKLRHNTDSEPWNKYDESYFDSATRDGGWYGKGLYASGNSWGENAYGKNTMRLYGYMENPAIVPPANIGLDELPENFTTSYIAKEFFNRGISKENYVKNLSDDALEWSKVYPELISKAIDNTTKADGVIVQREASRFHPFAPFNEVVLPKGTHIKSAEPFTLADDGSLIDLTDRANFNINDIRWFSTRPITRASKVHLTRNNPLQTRLARLREHTRYGFTPETNQGLMITPRIRSHYVKAFAKQIDPNLTEEQLNQIAQIAYANGRGMHISIGNNVGETIGGLSIVDIQNAIKYLKQSGIKDVTPNDIGIIAGHEAGHGVQISPAAKRAIEGFSEPDEFYTRAGQVLDAAGIKSTANKRIQFNQFMNMIDDYLSKGNLDNGVSEIRDFLRSKTKVVDRQNIMKHINELSSFSGAAYLGSKYYEKKIH